jgi:flagellar hook-associated protein 2
MFMVERLNGFSNSGIDIDTTVQKLMNAARIPYDRLGQKKQTFQWQRDDYRAMNAKFFDFRNTVFNMKLASTYGARKATSSDETTVSATATATANPGINTIKITTLAKAASVNSGALGAGSDSVTLGALVPPLAGTTSFTIGGEKGSATIELKGTDTIAGFVNAVNGKSATTGVQVSYDANMDRLFFTSSTTGNTSKIKLQMKSVTETVTGDGLTPDNLLSSVFKLPGSVVKQDAGQTIVGTTTFASSSALIDSAATIAQTLQINVSGTVTPYEFTIDNKTTVGQLINNINSSSLGKTGVSAYLDGNGHLAFFNPVDTNTLSFTDATIDVSDEVASLGLSDVPLATTNIIDYSEISLAGVNSVVEFNGVTTGFATNTFSINGVSFSAKKEGGPAVTLTVSQDTDTMFNSIKAFVDKYNDLISNVNTKLNEDYYKDFRPLTDTQKKDMKETDITNWEAKSKSGLLRRDSLLTSGLQSLRSGLSASVTGLPNGDFKSLSDIGVGSSLLAGTSISGSFLEQGKLYIDDAKLRKALDEKPEEVMNLFLAKDTDPTSDGADGIATRLYDRATSIIDKINNKAGAVGSLDNSFTIGKSVLTLNTSMSALSLKLDALQTRYYNQFTAMEKYINQMNMQSAQLANFGN